MRKLLLAALCCSSVQAAIVRGVVLDRATGRALARSLVSLRPVEGTGGSPQTVRAGRTGQFTFTVGAGMYLLRATRAGFAPFQYGQREWKSAGKPVFVDKDSALFLDIHLRRFAAISGTVYDENEVGIPEQKVIAYPAIQPLRIAATATTDDRGVLSHSWLGAPALITSAPRPSNWKTGPVYCRLSTKETTVVDQAMTVDVDLDQQADEVDIRPFPGKLFRVSGKVLVSPPAPVTVTLISDVGRVQTKTVSSFDFGLHPPGKYELIADGEDPYGRGRLGTYQEITVDRDLELQVHITSWRETEFRMEDEKGNAVSLDNAKITARRNDLDGGGHADVLKLANNRAALGPGHWEMSIQPPDGYYPVQLTGSYGADQQTGRADGWNEVYIRGFDTVRIKISSHPASIHGLVTGAGQDAEPGAPVYLEAFDKDTHQRVAELRTARTDMHGHYRFSGLTPGLYRIVSTFEYDKPDSNSMEACGARSVNLAEGADTAQDLDLYTP